MVDDRQAAILRAVVKQYIETSQPVSSTTVAAKSGISASSATIRGEMAILERDGYLRQPHTSAGRVPTDRGYRFFVDQLEGPGSLEPAQQHDVRTFFDKASGEIEQMLHDASRLLTDLTGAAAVVVGPDYERRTVRSIQIVWLGQRNALVVAVFSDGGVDKHSLDLIEEMTEAKVAHASNHVSTTLVGSALDELHTIESSGDQVVDELVNKAVDAMRNESKDDDVYVGGSSRLASAFDTIEVVRNVLTILEQQYVVVTLIRNLLNRGATVSIGAENQLAPLEHCSLVVAPTIVGGEQHGSVAVLGPTRMDYGQAMAAVSVVSRKLGERLEEK